MTPRRTAKLGLLWLLALVAWAGMPAAHRSRRCAAPIFALMHLLARLIVRVADARG